MSEPESFEHLRLGRKPTRYDDRTLAFASYVNVAALPPIPPTVLAPPLSRWPMYGNDELGDCTAAAAGHMVQAWSKKSTGHVFTPKTADVVRFYWETGTPPAETGVPGGPTDDGRVELNVLNAWRKTGFGGDRISAYVSIKPERVDLVKAAIYLFGGVYTGVALPVTAQQQPTLWDVVGDGKTGASQAWSWGGHAVPYVGYDAKGVRLVTWGRVIGATWGFHTAYTEEVYAILSPDWLTGGRSVHGFDVAALKNDLTALHRG